MRDRTVILKSVMSLALLLPGGSGSPDVGPYLISDGEIPRATCTASA